MKELELKCKACGERILLYTPTERQDLVVLAVHSLCALVETAA